MITFESSTNVKAEVKKKQPHPLSKPFAPAATTSQSTQNRAKESKSNLKKTDVAKTKTEREDRTRKNSTHQKDSLNVPNPTSKKFSLFRTSSSSSSSSTDNSDGEVDDSKGKIVRGLNGDEDDDVDEDEDDLASLLDSSSSDDDEDENDDDEDNDDDDDEDDADDDDIRDSIDNILGVADEDSDLPMLSQSPIEGLSYNPNHRLQQGSGTASVTGKKGGKKKVREGNKKRNKNSDRKRERRQKQAQLNSMDSAVFGVGKAAVWSELDERKKNEGEREKQDVKAKFVASSSYGDSQSSILSVVRHLLLPFRFAFTSLLLVLHPLLLHFSST